MSVKIQLCNILRGIKESDKLTYDQIIEKCEGGLHKSQLTSIIKHNGFNVSVETIESALNNLGVIIEIHIRDKT